MVYDINGNSIDNRLSGKKILAIGDSFVRGDTATDSQLWLTKLASRNNMTAYNHGINGASIAYSNPETYPSIMERYQSIISAVPSTDYVVVLAGHNDANPSIHGGTAIPIGENTDDVNTTFKGALNILISALLTAYPTAIMLFMSPFNRREYEGEYAEAMEEVTGLYSVPFYDNYKRSSVCFQNSAQKNAFDLNNTLHLNEAGHERFSYIVEEKLLSL